MKKILFTGMLFVTSLYIFGVNASASEDVEIKVLDEKTNEVIETNAKVKEINSIQGFDLLQSNSKEYEIEFKLPSSENSNNNAIQPFDSNSNTNNDGSVKATVKITYSLRNGDIKVTNGSCSWTPSKFISVSNRTLFMTNGKSTLQKNPTSNSASYNTNWGYVPKMGGNAGPSVQSQATVTASGMGGGYRIFASVFL